jgi:hypothetical protein
MQTDKILMAFGHATPGVEHMEYHPQVHRNRGVVRIFYWEIWQTCGLLPFYDLQVPAIHNSEDD